LAEEQPLSKGIGSEHGKIAEIENMGFLSGEVIFCMSFHSIGRGIWERHQLFHVKHCVVGRLRVQFGKFGRDGWWCRWFQPDIKNVSHETLHIGRPQVALFLSAWYNQIRRRNGTPEGTEKLGQNRVCGNHFAGHRKQMGAKKYFGRSHS
jgi:hypothetical protein